MPEMAGSLKDRVAERIGRWIDEKIITDRNIELFLKYYWIVSTFRLVLGFTLLVLIVVMGYRLDNLVPK